ncbi:MAG: lysylphosphatidylglycerol synthase transmembrane domain-containing protein, partial [Ignavibacteria bacterium]
YTLMFSKYKKKILLSVTFGALVFLAFSIYADFGNLLVSFSKFNWYWLPAVLALSFGNYIVRFFKWQYYLKILNISIKPLKSFLIFFSSFIMSVTPGKMGEVLKSFLLKEETGTPVSVSAPIILAERITDFLSIVILCIIGAVVFDYGRDIVIVTGVFFVLLTIILSSKKLSLKIISIFERIKFTEKHAEKLYTAYESTYNLIKLKPLLIVVGMSLIAWFFECLGFYIVLRVFTSVSNIEVTVLTATFIYTFSTLVGAIAMLPGGLGVTEASLTGLLIFLKIPKDISVAATIIIRVATLWFAVILGVIAVQIYGKCNKINTDEMTESKLQ